MRTRFMLTIAFTTIGVTAGAYVELHHTGPDIRILTGQVSRGDIVSTVITTGTVEASQTVQVGAEVSGLVTQLGADFDSIVRKGDILARIDPSEIQAEVTQAKADVARARADEQGYKVALDEARAQLGRFAYLTASGTNPQADADAAQVAATTAEAQLEAAEGDVKQAQAVLAGYEVDLSHTIIRSPLDGIVVGRMVDLGQTLVPRLEAPTLFEIAGDLSKLQIDATVDESDIAKVRAGQHAGVEVDAYKGQIFDGVVSQVRIGPEVDQGVVSYVAVIEVPNPTLKLRPGMTAFVTIESARRANVLRVPVSAVHFTPSAKVFAALHQPSVPASGASWSPKPGASRSPGRVWTYAGGRLSPVAVTLGLSDGANIELLDNSLPAGVALATATAAAKR